MKALLVAGLAIGFSQLMFAGETKILNHSGLTDWTPPVVKEKVWSKKTILTTRVRKQGGRKVILEECSSDRVAKLQREIVPVKSTTSNETPSEIVEQLKSTGLIHLSASVYEYEGRKFSKLKMHYGKDTCEAWSSLDFNLFRGVTAYVVDGHQYHKFAGIGDIEYPSADEVGCPSELLQETGNAFMIMETNAPDHADNNAVLAVQHLHQLYQVEAPYLEAYMLKSEENRKLQEDWKKANPEKPKDVKIRFWKRQKLNDQ